VATYGIAAAAPPGGTLAALSPHAVTTFIAASVFFGSLVIVATPPLRGPDETAHFLRAYGVAMGDIVPSLRDAQGRKGVLLSARLYAGFQYFEGVRIKEKDTAWPGYGPEFQTYFSRSSVPAALGTGPTFVAYAGSEGYSPVAYVAHIVAAFAARALDLDFLATFYLMRFAGLAAMTALIGFAISLVPQIAWPLAALAMLPAALYGRSVINADGSALAAAMVVSALWLRGMLFPRMHSLGRQSFWMMLNALTKPPNLAFVLLELNFEPAETVVASTCCMRAARHRRCIAVELFERNRHGSLANGRNYRTGAGRVRSSFQDSPSARSAPVLSFRRR